VRRSIPSEAEQVKRPVTSISNYTKTAFTVRLYLSVFSTHQHNVTIPKCLKEFFVYAYYNETEQFKKSQKITTQDKIRYSLFGRGFSLLSFVKEKSGLMRSPACLCLPLINFLTNW
jgi:hypothetical protein